MRCFWTSLIILSCSLGFVACNDSPYSDLAQNQPDMPDTPNNPDLPNTPDNPDTPNNPDTPDTPNNPDRPDLPQEPYVNPTDAEILTSCQISDAALDGTFVRIPKGKWSNVDFPSDQIAAFDLHRREVTIAEYEACVEAGVCSARHGSYRFDTPRTAVSYVNADEAETYCKWIGVRLPTYYEWQYAASHDGHKVQNVFFPWGNKLPHFCVEAAYSERIDDEYGRVFWTCINGNIVRQMGSVPSIVGCYPKGDTPTGLQDMSGNMAEWVRSKEGWPHYVGGSIGAGLNELAIWDRIHANLTNRELDFVGFRCAKDVDVEELTGH